MKKNMSKDTNRKISETFIEFSSPLLDALGKDATKDQIEKALQITYTVWNSVVLDAAKNSSEHLTMLRQTIRDDPITVEIVEQFISRKNDLFCDDLRVIRDYTVTQKMGERRLRAEARFPKVTS